MVLKYLHQLRVVRTCVLALVFFFFAYKSVFAVPFLWVIPFVFEIGILAYTFGIMFLSSLVFFYFRYIRFFSYLLIFISFATSIYLCVFVSWSQLQMIHLAFDFGNPQYITLASIYLVICILLVWFVKKVYIAVFLQVFSILFIMINISLLYSSIELNAKFDYLIDSFNKSVDNSLIVKTEKIRNHIFISQDFSYQFEGEQRDCRVTISYYLHTWEAYQKEAPRIDELQLYTGLDKGICRSIITPTFRALSQ